MDNKKYDLTRDEILSPKKIRYTRTAGLVVGTANEIAMHEEYGTFCENDGKCDCCGGFIYPWIIGGLCKSCLIRMDDERKNIIFPEKKQKPLLPYPQKSQKSKISNVLLGAHAESNLMRMIDANPIF